MKTKVTPIFGKRPSIEELAKEIGGRMWARRDAERETAILKHPSTSKQSCVTRSLYLVGSQKVVVSEDRA
jgi:gentisate 1,2-dioxygenase